MEKIKCIICSSDNNLLYTQVSDRFNEEDSFNIVQCNCGFVYLNPRPDIQEIASYYNHENYIPHQSKNFNLFNLIYGFVQKFIFYWKYNKINSYIDNSPINLLDIGSGNGSFLDYLSKKININIFVNEPFVKLNYPSLNIEDNTTVKCEIISMWHSLEHIHDINSIFTLIDKILTVDGTLIIAVPNIEAYERKFLKSDWIAYDSPRHLYHFSIDTLAQLLNKYNFTIIKKHSMIQDSIFNILGSGKSNKFFRLIKSLYYIPMTLSSIFLNKNLSSSLLYICKRK